MTFRPTAKHPGIWPGLPGGHAAGVEPTPSASQAQAAARETNLAKGRRHKRGGKAFGFTNGTIPGLSETVDEKERIRAKARASRDRGMW